MKGSIQKLYFDHQKKLRFLFAGLVNTCVGLATYPILYFGLHPYGFGYIQILVLAQFICITISFISNKYFVFKSKGKMKYEYIKFFAFHGLFFSLNLIVLPILVEVMKLNPMLAQTIFSVLIIVTSYFWHNSFTFKAPKETSR